MQLTATTARFFNYALAVLANPSAYPAAKVAKCSALVDAYNAGNRIQFKSLILAW